MPHWLRALSCAIWYPMVTSLVMRAYLYGITDNNVFRMGLYTLLPTILFFSLDLLCRLIKMYQFGLEVLKKQNKEKEE